MPQISSSQLRAARALLNWSRTDLSKLSGISEPTIHRFENGINEPEARTTNKIIEIFDKHGVEFSARQGVCFKSNEIDVYDGRERFRDFYDYLYKYLDQFGGDICVSIYDQMLLVRLRADNGLHQARMKKLFDQKKITFRILVSISDFKTYGYAATRWLSKRSQSPTGFYAFGNCLALMSFVDEDCPHVVVIHSGPLADAYRQDFNIEWRLGQKPPPPSVIAKMLADNGYASTPSKR